MDTSLRSLCTKLALNLAQTRSPMISRLVDVSRVRRSHHCAVVRSTLGRDCPLLDKGMAVLNRRVMLGGTVSAACLAPWASQLHAADSLHSTVVETTAGKVSGRRVDGITV